MKVYGYIRVSSDKQTVENQRYEINKFCEKVLKFIAYQRIRAETGEMMQFPPEIIRKEFIKLLRHHIIQTLVVLGDVVDVAVVADGFEVATGFFSHTLFTFA